MGRIRVITVALAVAVVVNVYTGVPSSSTQSGAADRIFLGSWRPLLEEFQGYRRLEQQVGEDKALQTIALIETSTYPDMIRALIDVESSWRVQARSKRDARGLMQIRPVAAREVDPDLNPVDLYDPVINVRTGIVIFEEHMEYFMGYDDPVEWALTSYNRGRAGTFALQMYPPSTRYSRKVLRHLGG